MAVDVEAKRSKWAVKNGEMAAAPDGGYKLQLSWANNVDKTDGLKTIKNPERNLFLFFSCFFCLLFWFSRRPLIKKMMAVIMSCLSFSLPPPPPPPPPVFPSSWLTKNRNFVSRRFCFALVFVIVSTSFPVVLF